MKKKIEEATPPAETWRDRNAVYIRGKSGVTVWSNHDGHVVLQVNVVDGLNCREELVRLTPDNAVELALALSTAAAEGLARVEEVKRLTK